jgi:16S rRNA (guanine527-N7)-methyltransferase
MESDSSHSHPPAADASTAWWELPGLSISPKQVEQLQMLAQVFREWNERLNLVSRKDMESFEAHHLKHALLMARLLPWREMPGVRVLDVGTGGGLPGLPLAILFPQTQFFLCDSITKKTVAVADMVQKLGLKNVEVVNKRAETLESKWNYIIGRAVTALPQFLGWISKNLRAGGPAEFPHGVLYLKGTLYEEELASLELTPFRVHHLVDGDEDPYFADKFLVHLQADVLLAHPALQPPPPEPKKKVGKKKKKRR